MYILPSTQGKKVTTVNPLIFASINFCGFAEIEYSRPFTFAIHNKNLNIHRKFVILSMFLKFSRPLFFAIFFQIRENRENKWTRKLMGLQ